MKELLSTVATVLTIVCMVLQTFACVVGLVQGSAERHTSSKGFTSKSLCDPPYNKIVNYVAPGFKMGCWLSKQ